MKCVQGWALSVHDQPLNNTIKDKLFNRLVGYTYIPENRMCRPVVNISGTFIEQVNLLVIGIST